MNLKDQLEIDVIEFFNQIESQNQNDQRKTLRNLMDKYIHLSTSDHLLDSHDLRTIIGSASNKFANEKFPIHLGSGKKLVNQNDLPNLCVIEATIGHLSKLDCLKKTPKFNKVDDKF